ncbi:MAG: DUF2911 domain-containing protein [Candidatus Acidiferrales bacterium]
MRRCVAVATLMVAWFFIGGTGLKAQSAVLNPPDLSQRARVMQRIGITDMTIAYHRSLTHGRESFGSLPPYGQVWRASADYNTTIEFSDPVTIEGRRTLQRIFALLAATASLEGAQQASPRSSVVRQSLNDVWWTGPMLAPSAATLPRGHFLIEPYFYDVTSGHSNTFGSLSYVLYGLTDRLTVGLIPTVDYEKVSNGPSSSNIQLGDTGLLAQYGLTRFHEGSWRPATAINVQETFPTGKYDRLGNRPSDGFGSGAYTTALALYTQTYFWLPNGRILRMRFNVSQAFSSNVNVEDVSVYGTAAGFRGNARPANTSYADAAWEYSLTRRWVLALDVEYRDEGNTRVTGYNTLDPVSLPNPPSIQMDSGSSDAIIFAPAIEYNWKSNLGVLLGTRVIELGHNTPATITPAVAINFVR